MDIGDEIDVKILAKEQNGIKASLGVSPQAKWKERVDFESRDSRRGYRAGYNARSRGKSILPPDLPDSEWGVGYRRGFEARNSSQPTASIEQ